MNDLMLTIDRIVLTDLGATPERTEHIRALVEVELQRLLERQGLPSGLASGEVPHLEAPTMNLTEPHNDSRLAGGLARGIAQSLRGAG